MRRAARALRLVVVATAGAVSALGRGPVALAAERLSEAKGSGSVVRVYVTGPGQALDRLRVTVTELCARLNLTVIVEQGAGEAALGASAPRAFAVAFVDFSSPLPRVVVVDGDAHRELERRTLPRAASLELSVEEAGHVLYMAVESSLRSREHRGEGAGAGTGVMPSDASAGGHPASPEGSGSPPADDGSRARRPTGAEPPPDASRRDPDTDAGSGRPARGESRMGANRFEAEVSAFGSAVAFSGARVLPGLGASLDAGVRHEALRATASLSIGASLSSTVTLGGETASLRADAARLLAAGEWEPGALFAVFAGIGGGADRIAVGTTEPPPGVWAAGSAPRIDPVLEGLVGAKVLLSNVARAMVGIAMDVDLEPHRYVIEDGAARRTLFDAQRVRPRAFVGLSFLLSGGTGAGTRGARDP